MKYETYRIKYSNVGCGFYYKVVTTEIETDIYFVRSNDKGDILSSIQLYDGKPMCVFEVADWLNAFLKRGLNELSFARIERD